MWPEYNYDISKIPVARADRGPCIVCGHPTGDCVGNSSAPTHIVGEEFARTKPKKSDRTVLVHEDIWETVWLTGTTSTKVLVARAGQYVTPEVARKYGLLT